MSSVIDTNAKTITISRGTINSAKNPTITLRTNGVFNFDSHAAEIKNALDFIFDPSYYDNSALKGYLNTYSINSGAEIVINIVRDDNDGRSGWLVPFKVDGKTVVNINWSRMFRSDTSQFLLPYFEMSVFHELVHASGLSHSVLYNIVYNEKRDLQPVDFAKDPVFRATAEFVLRRGLPFSDMSSGTQVVRWPGDPLYPVLTGDAQADATAISTYITKNTTQNTAKFYSDLAKKGGALPSYSDVDVFVNSYINSFVNGFEDGRYLGNLLGSTIGGLIGGNSLVGNLAGRSLFSVIGAKIGSAIGAAYATGDIAAGIDILSATTFTEIKGQLGSAVQASAVGTVSSILTMEMADALGLDGVAGRVFGNVVGSVLQQVANNAISNINVLSNLDQVKDVFGVVWDTPAAGSLAVTAISTFLGNRLGSMVVNPQTSAGVILSNLGSAAGAYAFSAAGFGWGASIFGLANSSFWAANVVFPGVGAFVGFVMGALIGNLFGKKRPKPSASADTTLNFASGYYQLGAVTVNGGNRALVETMALEARDILNGLIQVVSGDVEKAPVVNTNSPTQQYGHTNTQIWAKFNGTQQNFADAAAAVEWGTVQAIRQTQIAGGDMLAKRVLTYSSSTTLSALAGDLQIAHDYGRYLRSREDVNSKIMEPWNSLTAAEKSLFNDNQAVMTRLLAKDDVALSTSDNNFYIAHKTDADNIIAKLKASEFAAGWMITLQRAAELKLDEWKPSDFYGGVRGLLESFHLLDLGVGYEQVALSWNGTDLSVAAAASSLSGLFSGATTASTDGRSFSVTGFGPSVGYAFGSWNASQGRYTTTKGNDFLNGTSLGSVTFDDLYNGTSGGDDLFIGSANNDTLRGRDGHDWLQGGAGDDLLEGGAGNDVLIGGLGSDTLYGEDGDDYLAGGEGFDHHSGSNTAGLHGGAGNDILVQNVSGPTEAWGDDGDDLFIMIADNNDYDFAYGGNGSDTISYERYATGVNIDMNVGANAEFRTIMGDTIGAMENVTGSAFNDTLIGDAGANIIKGLSGDDALSGGDGNDTLEGGLGKDTLNGGNGTDTLSYAKSVAAVSVNLATGDALGGDASGDTWSNIENLSGSMLDDLLGGNTGANLIQGLRGNDWLLASAGADTLDGGDGFDTVDYSGFTSAVTVNLGGAGSNTSHTYISIEHLVGSAFADQLTGSANDEAFTGGAGNDTMSGGNGADRYYFAKGDGVDTVYDNVSGNNNVTFKGASWSDLWFGAPGSPVGYSGSQLQVGYRGTSDQAQVISNFVGTSEAPSNVIKTISLDNGASLDVSGVTMARDATDGDDTRFGLQNATDMIFGYNGNDTIYGAPSGLVESNGNVIAGGKGNDSIFTSNGDDQFAFDRGDGIDTITDTGGDDTLVIGPNTKAEDVLFEVDQNNGDLYIGLRDFSNAALTASQVADRVRIVGGGYNYVYTSVEGPAYNTIEYVQVGGTSINLTTANINWKIKIVRAPGTQMPIVFDLGNDGLDLSTVDDSSIVTRTDSGALIRMGWVGPTDGILAIDRNGDGQINKLSEISFVTDLPGAKTDLEGLAAYDNNKDGVLDAKDKRFGEFRIWVDANQNGRSTAKELRTLTAAGITSIKLQGAETGLSLANTIESHAVATTSFTRKDGSSGTAYDVALARRFVNQVGLADGTVPDRFSNAGKEDAVLGRLEADPRLSVLSGKSSLAGALDGLVADAMAGLDSLRDALSRGQVLDYDTIASRAVVDFSDHDKISAADALKWADQLAGRKKATLADGGWSSASQKMLDKVRAVSADGKQTVKTQGVAQGAPSASEERDIETTLTSDNPSATPRLDTDADTLSTNMISSGRTYDNPSSDLADAAPARATGDYVTPWYLYDGSDSLTGGRVAGFGIGLGALEGVAPVVASKEAASGTVALPPADAADQQRLVQALAAFRGSSGMAAVRGREGQAISGELLAAPALLDRLPSARHLAA